MSFTGNDDHGWAIFDSGPGALGRRLRGLLNDTKTTAPGPLTGEDMFAMLKKLREQLDSGPPPIKALVAHHAVPFGKTYRQWNTRGELLVWVNRGQIHGLPRTKYAGIDIAISGELVPPGLAGVPVVYA